MKKVWPIVSILILITKLHSQTVEFYHSYHFNDLNYGGDIIYTSDSHYVAVGCTYSMNVWETYKSFLVKMDAEGDSLFIRHFPFDFNPQITETHDHNYCIGTDNFNYKMTRDGDSVWHKPAEITGEKQWIAGITATSDGSFFTISTQFDLINLGDPFGRIKQYDSLGDFVSESSFLGYADGVDIGSSPSGEVYGIANSLYGATPFFKKVGSRAIPLDTIQNSALDLCILNDSMLFLLGRHDVKTNLIRLNQDGQITCLVVDICPQPAYQLCKLNDSTLLIAGSNENGLRLSQVTAGLELTGTVVLQDFPGHAIGELVYITDQKVAVVGYTGPVNVNTTMYVMGLIMPAYHLGLKEDLAEKPVVYPNPSIGIFHVNTKDIGDIHQAIVFQVDGRIIPGCITYHNGKMMIDLSRYKSGIYILKLNDGTNSYVTKLILDR